MAYGWSFAEVVKERQRETTVRGRIFWFNIILAFSKTIITIGTFAMLRPMGLQLWSASIHIRFVVVCRPFRCLSLANQHYKYILISLIALMTFVHRDRTPFPFKRPIFNVIQLFTFNLVRLSFPTWYIRTILLHCVVFIIRRCTHISFYCLHMDGIVCALPHLCLLYINDRRWSLNSVLLITLFHFDWPLFNWFLEIWNCWMRGAMQSSL